MKKKIKILALALVSVLLIQSCQKDELPQNAEKSSLINDGLATGYIPSTPEQLAQVKELKASSFTKKEALPSKYVLPELPAALNQGNKGACASYSIAHALTIINGESKILANGSPNYNAYASPDYLHEKYKAFKNSCESGAQFIEALDALKTEGTTSYSDMGYVACGTLPTVAQVNNAKKNRINDYYRLKSATGKPTLEQIKEQIANGNPVIVGVAVDWDFTSFSLRLWDINSTSYYGAHGVVLTGYDNEKQAFRLLNSWGLTGAKTDIFGLLTEK
ncbi:C1 family peptidase [Flavobacterium sp. MMS24-S5]|uniref:C1 family peptidase n=1 Tax=Flavobacterium sp. MMS24-S5 TaxID=3416605 RepID=UPI003D087A5C